MYILVSIIFVLSIIFFALFIYLIYQRQQEKRLWNGKGMVKDKHKSMERVYLKIYRFLSSYPLTRGYTEKISYRYRLVNPCNNNAIAVKTVASCIISWIISILVFAAIYLVNRRLINLIIAAMAIVIINSEVIGRIAKYYEINTLKEIQKMIMKVEHNFYIEYRIDDAVYRTRDILHKDMKAVSDKIYELLLSDDKEDELRKFHENIPNKYLKEFVSQCVAAMEQGVQEVNGEILFIKNMENLYRELDIEIDKLQRLYMEFMGVILCVVAPIFCIDFVVRFAIGIKENMDTFYYGKAGFLFDICLLSAIYFIYIIMQKSAEYVPYRPSDFRILYRIDQIPFIKQCMDNYSTKNAARLERLNLKLRNNGSNIKPRHFVMRSFLIAGVILLLGIGMMFYLHHLSKEQLLAPDQSDIEVLTSAAKENQYEAMSAALQKYTKKYAQEVTMPANPDAIVAELERETGIYNKMINNALVEEIMRRVDQYKNEYFSVTDLVTCLLISVLSFYLPYLLLIYHSSVSKDAMEDEVNQFHALICMMMHDSSVTVKQILEEMESFSSVFKQSIRTCINNYSSGDLVALNQLKEQEPYEAFQSIIDNLIRCDDVPISQAFHEIDVERDGYMARRKLANEKSIKSRVMKAYLLALIPFALLFAYGLIPTLMASMAEINQLIEELNAM